MGCQINKISNVQLDEIARAHAFPMNSLGILMSYKYLSSIVKLNWSDIAFAIENKYLLHEAAIEHAMWGLESDSYHQRVMDLACLIDVDVKYMHALHPYIDELVKLESEDERNKAKDKIMYAVLKWTFDHREQYEDPLQVVVFIYADFGYPKQISNLIVYRPMTEPDLGSIAQNKQRLINRWKVFLDEQGSKYLEGSLEGSK